MNPFRKYKIDYLLFGGFAVFFILLLSIVIWISYSFSSRELVRNTSYYQQGLLNEINKNIVTGLESIEQTALAVSRNADLSDFLAMQTDEYTRYRKMSDIAAFLANITYSTTILQSIDLYMDKPLIQLYGPNTFQDLNRVSEESWYPSLRNTDFVWLGEHTIQTNKGPVPAISFARKIYSAKGQYQGILVFNLKAASVKKLIQGETENSNRILLDSGGRPVTMVGDPYIETNIKAMIDPAVTETGYKKARSEDSQGKPVDSLIVWSKFFNSNWMLVEITPWDRITKGSTRLAVILIVIGLAAVLLGLLFTLILSRQFLKPLKLLVREMRTFSLKAGSIKLPRNYKNEFGTLFNGYRTLVERIQALYKTLEEQHHRQRIAEIQALQAMINPHFLYNTLDQLNWMAIEAGQEKISHVLELMGRMFRIGLSNGESLIPIADELSHIECYIEIQNIREEGRLRFDIDVPERIRALYIPKLTLQPFVENAVIHGFHGKETGEIAIQAVEAEKGILFTVSDNGVGMREGWQSAPSRNKGGYGIRNVKERLEAYFGHGYGVEINSKEGEGTIVTVLFPRMNNRQPEVPYVENRAY